MARYKQVFIIFGIFVVILLIVKGPMYFQTHTETNVNNVELEKRPESYQYNEKSSYKLPTPIRPIDPLEAIR